MSTNHLDEHHDIFKERESKFHSRIVNLKEDLDNLLIIHRNLLHASLQKEMEYNITVSRLNQDIKLLEEDYNELLAIHKRKEIEFNKTVALYEEKQRQCNQTISLCVQRELESNITINVCQQNVQSLTETVNKQKQSMQQLRQEIKVASSGSMVTITESIWPLSLLVLRAKIWE